jgi:hypothetical protein
LFYEYIDKQANTATANVAYGISEAISWDVKQVSVKGAS